VLQGFGALLEALRFAVGSVEDALSFLDVNRSGSVSLMEFVGSMGLLGLDLSLLCGTDDATAFRELAAASGAGLGPRGSTSSSRGSKPAGAGALIRLEALARSRSAGLRRSAAVENDVDHDAAAGLRKAQAKWAAVARWMAAATRRSAALTEERFARGWRMTPAAALDAAEAGEAPAAPAPGGHDDGPAPGRRRRRCAAPPGEVMLTTAAAMRECEQDLRAFFIKASSSTLPEAPQEQLMDRQDLHGFFADLQLVEPVRHKKAKDALDLRYDEALALQADQTKIDSGLLFWSFKALLNNIVGDMRLGWGSLVRRTIQKAGGACDSP